MRLARPPEKIRIGDVVRHSEQQWVLAECFDPDTSGCRIERACGLRSVLEEALEAFLAKLDDYTVADIVARRRLPLLRILEGS